MVANYASKAFSSVLGGAHYHVPIGATRDTVTDAAVIALWPADFTATAPVASASTITGVMAGWLAAYPRGEVK